MEKTEQKESPNEAMEVEGFPNYDEEYESVKRINKRMREARNDWNPPDKPSYKDESGGKDVYYVGVVRSIEEETVSVEDYDHVKLGIDTGDKTLEWVRVKDTGEKTLKNPYIRFCQMYDVDTETVEDLYGTKIYVNSRWNKPVVKPSQPIVKGLWNLHHIQNKLGFYEYQEKGMFEGLVPRFRHLATYTILSFTLGVLSTYMSLFLPLFFVVTLIFMWGLYAKTRYDILPYIEKMISHYWEIYAHKKA